MKYIQSFYQYPVTLSSIGKTIPARSAQGPLKNLMEIEDKELDRVQNSEPFFRELVAKKKIRVLNHMPESYVSSAQRINEAQDEIARLKAENEALKAKAGKPAQNDPDEDAPAEAEAPQEEEAPAEEPKKTSSKKSKK
ncbi:MAG: hypothetical protein IIZ93_08845 [Acidaminococcaceae bacterium]|nr:hypothetical protein [Acidaminococcaceae bacterium]